MPSLLAMKALPEILPFVSHIISLIISRIISLIPLWTFADFTASAASATFRYKEQCFWSGPILPLEYCFLFDELGDDFIGRGGHHGVFVHHELQEDFQPVIPEDSVKELQDVLFLTQLDDCLCRVRFASIRITGRWGRRSCAEIVVVDFPIDPQCVIVDMSAVL
jgi:hypothetical protein